MMRVALPMSQERIAPVFDVAKRFVILKATSAGEIAREEVLIEHRDPVAKIRFLMELGVDVLICGAISWPLEAMLAATGVSVVPNTCGPVEDVAAAFFAGELNELDFLMPGCHGRRGRRRRRRGRPWHNGA